MDLNDIIYEQGVEQENENNLSDEDYVRIQYEKAYPEDYASDDAVLFDAVRLSPMFSEEKVSKAGNTYQSNKCILTFYNDVDELQVPFYVENFRDYDQEKDSLKVKGSNPLCRLLQGLTQGSNNYFRVNFDGLRKVVDSIGAINVSIETITQSNGYTDYTFKVNYIKD